jgi:uncharacterized protein
MSKEGSPMNYEDSAIVEMELFEIRIDETKQEQLIILKEKEGERRLPIVIGMHEAIAIHQKIVNIIPQRPLTHDLLNQVVGGLGGRLIRIIVDSLEDHIFYAKLDMININGEAVRIDSRPSDAIALAVRTGADIYVEASVLSTAGIE